MASVRNAQPHCGCNFLIKVKSVNDDGQAVSGCFSKVNGLDIEVQQVDFREGSSKIFVQNVNDATEHADITCKRGITENQALGTWPLQLVQGQHRHTSGSILPID